MITHKPCDLFPCGEIAVQLAQHVAGNLCSHKRVLERARPTRFWIQRGRGRLAGVMKEPCEQQLDLRRAIECRPFGQPFQFSTDHFRVGPDIPFGVPLSVLLAARHVVRPGLGFRPCQNLCVARTLDVAPGFHAQISTPSASRFGIIFWCCQCSLCFTFSTNSDRTILALPVTRPSASVRQ